MREPTDKQCLEKLTFRRKGKINSKQTLAKISKRVISLEEIEKFFQKEIKKNLIPQGGEDWIFSLESEVCPQAEKAFPEFSIDELTKDFYNFIWRNCGPDRSWLYYLPNGGSTLSMWSCMSVQEKRKVESIYKKIAMLKAKAKDIREKAEKQSKELLAEVLDLQDILKTQEYL